ncbi:MAG TPA: Gfo/Idh/MocA family oxidoreductase [Phycisphaerae bacterium]|nr:Gfo/Idh/MocA family oxidoreductase [Phycisphaerae bacterium]
MRRRDFLRKSAAAAAAGISVPYFVPSHVLGKEGKRGPNDKIRLGFIGTGGRGQYLMADENLTDHAVLVALCDCFLPRTEQAAKKVPNGDKIARYQDYQDMLEKEKLDAVFVSTTTHARVLACIHAMQAGLDVYAEKPVSLTIAEGRALVKAARKYKRVFQVGTQQRSMPINVHASRLVREGKLGRISEVISYNFEDPKRWEPKPAEPIPDGLDWDKWCSQTEMRPYHKELYYQWNIWWDYDCGGQSWGISGWGTHGLDQAQCALGTDDTCPVEYWLEGEGKEPPVTCKYADGTLLKLMGYQPKLKQGEKAPPEGDLKGLFVGHEALGAIFVGEKGRLKIMRGKVATDQPELLKDAPPANPEGPGECKWHIDNFFECVRTREKPNADVEIAHRATSLCQIIAICRDLKRKLKWDPQAERFIGDDEANKMLSRPRRKGYELPAEFA